MSSEYDRQRYLELNAKEQELIQQRDALGRKMSDLLYAEGMTDRKRKLAQKYDNATFTFSFLCFIFPILFFFPYSPLSLKIKYLPIRKCYIIPKEKYAAELLQLNESIRSVSSSKMVYGPAGSTRPSDAAVEIVKKAKETNVTVTIDYDIDPGDCGDCY